MTTQGFHPDTRPSFIDTSSYLYGAECSDHDGIVRSNTSLSLPAPNTLAALPKELLDDIFASIIAAYLITSAAQKRRLSSGIWAICENAIPELHHVNRSVAIASGRNLRPVAVRCYFEQTMHEAVISATATGTTVAGTFVETGVFKAHGKRLKVTLHVADRKEIGSVVTRLRAILVGCKALRQTEIGVDAASGLSDAERGELRARVLKMLKEAGDKIVEDVDTTGL
ncbi:hypothetical protein LTR95_000617 [Oleoguttula sp. CCFEE 5521]